ncbi:hypothetical protein GOBAR_AA35489 [Gossypium barbadense]|uniref:Uncharacterized protein n=1 Tax=Gossypium barbadense TaxID=3634 RepID=A0A2P5W281_GOSBA|nr:hypothetical protein GOBAR_AA35489 [Gossypium barbadense]
MITLQARNFGSTLNIEGNGPHQSTQTNNMTRPTLQELSLQEVHDPCSSNDQGHIHEERRLRIEELDKWRAHKPRTHDKPKLRQKEFDTSPNKLKVGDKVLLDVADPHIVTTTPNEEIPLTVLSIFPFDIAEVSHLYQVIVKRKENHRTYFEEEEGSVLFHGPNQQVQMVDAIRALLTTDPWELFFMNIEPTYLELTMELCSMFHLQTVMTRYDDPGMVQFCLGGLIYQPRVPKFGAALGLCMEEFREENELHALSRHIHFPPSKC